MSNADLSGSEIIVNHRMIFHFFGLGPKTRKISKWGHYCYHEGKVNTLAHFYCTDKLILKRQKHPSVAGRRYRACHTLFTIYIYIKDLNTLTKPKPQKSIFGGSSSFFITMDPYKVSSFSSYLFFPCLYLKIDHV